MVEGRSHRRLVLKTLLRAGELRRREELERDRPLEPRAERLVDNDMLTRCLRCARDGGVETEVIRREGTLPHPRKTTW